MYILNKKLSLLFIVFAIIISGPVARCQSVPQMDLTVSKYLEEINFIYSMEKQDAEESDTLRRANKKLLEYMKQVCTNPDALDRDLPHSEEVGLLYATSDDHRLRFYAWDTWTGSSMHYFNVIAQYKVGSKSKWSVINEISMGSNETHDPGAYFTDITRLHTKDNKTVYMTVDCTIASAKDKANRVQAYTIQNGDLVTLPFFKKDKEVTNEIDFVYNYAADSSMPEVFNVQFTGMKDRMSVPIVAPNGRLTKERVIYDFDGYKFILNKKDRKKIEAGM